MIFRSWVQRFRFVIATGTQTTENLFLLFPKKLINVVRAMSSEPAPQSIYFEKKQFWMCFTAVTIIIKDIVDKTSTLRFAPVTSIIRQYARSLIRFADSPAPSLSAHRLSLILLLGYTSPFSRLVHFYIIVFVDITHTRD